MTQWEVFLVIIVVLEFIALILNGFVNPRNKKDSDLTKVIQQNTDAINNLTDKLDTLTSENSKEHEDIYKTIDKHTEHINKNTKDLAVLKEKHKSDVEFLKSYHK